MKKKLLSLILVMMLLPIASLFSACGNDDAYNLDALNNDFNAIVDQNNNIKNENGKFVFDYSGHKNLATIILTIEPYCELEKYNQVFYNLMGFAYDYVPVCSNNALTDNVNIKNKVKEDLEDLKKAIGDVNKSLNMFAEGVIIASGDDVTSDACRSTYEALLTNYSAMFERAIKFNTTLSNLYFNNVLKDGNPNVYAETINSFDSNMIVNKLKARIKYQISCLTHSFVEMYVDGDLAHKVAFENIDFDMGARNYSENVSKLISKQDFSEQVAAEIANHSDNKERFYNLAIQAQNFQTTIQNDMGKFITASLNIHYSGMNFETASVYEKFCADIIESNYDLICGYNEVLYQILQIIN